MKPHLFHIHGGERHRRPADAAFTLIELLTVMGIMAVLMTVVIPAMTGLLESTNITRAGQMLGDQINLARQIASSSNTVVEVRLFNLSDVSATGYSGVQVWAPNRSGVVSALKPMMLLPQGTVITENTTFSAALAQPLTTGVMPSGGSNTSGARYVAFQIRPSGVVMPCIEMKQFFFCILPIRAIASGTLPTNYVTLQINPLTATPLIYRP